RAMEASDGLPDALRAEGLLYLGILVWQKGSLDAAEKAISASHELFAKLGDANGVARAQGNLANLSFRRGDLATAATRYKPVAAFFRDGDDLERLAPTLENFGVVESQLGRFDNAQTL